MRSHSVVWLFFGVVLGQLVPRNCNADNCARAVSGERYQASVQSAHTVDCKSFMSITVVPATPTTTITTTVRATSYSVVGSIVKREVSERDGGWDFMLYPPPPATTGKVVRARNNDDGCEKTTIRPTAIPTYATTACMNSREYSSACSCAGIKPTTTTSPTPATVTKTKTKTKKGEPTVIPVCDPADGYGYKYVGGNIQAGAGLTQVSTSESLQQCCASCFAPGSKCFVYEYYNDICFHVLETGGTESPTDYCPFGVYGIGNPGSGNFYGLGPCAKFI